MSQITLGILGGGQLGSMLSVAAKKLNIKTVIYCNDGEAPAKNFCDDFIYAEYDNIEIGDEILVVILGKKYELHDKKISIISKFHSSIKSSKNKINENEINLTQKNETEFQDDFEVIDNNIKNDCFPDDEYSSDNEL